MLLDPFWTSVLALALGAYVLLMLGIGVFSARSRGGDQAEDFLLAGRSTPVPLAALSLVATWYGAGVMLTVADNVAVEGVFKAIMDPLGVTLCLLLAACWLARPLWEMGIITLCDYYRRRYGVAAEKVSALILVPSYFGWIAVQFVVLARILEQCLGIPAMAGIAVVMLAGTVYTLLGGMRAVILTDTIQMAILVVGLVLMVGMLSWEAGWSVAGQSIQSGFAGLPSTEKFLLGFDLLLVGSLGNLPAQDLLQRMLCVDSARKAALACYISAGWYLLFGLFPVALGLLSARLAPEQTQAVVMGFAQRLMSGPLMIVFVLAVVSAVLSTVSGAILAPSGVVAQNLVSAGMRARWGPVAVNRVAVVVIAALSLATAYSGRKTFDLLEEAYSLMMVGLLVPLLGGIWLPRRPPVAAMASMLAGSAVWVWHLLSGWDEWFLQSWLVPRGITIPANLAIMLLAAVVFLIVGRSLPFSGPVGSPAGEAAAT